MINNIDLLNNCKAKTQSVIEKFVNENFDKYFIKIQKQIIKDANNGYYKSQINLNYFFGFCIDFSHPKYKRLSDNLKKAFIDLGFTSEYHTIDYLNDHLIISWKENDII